MKRRRFTEHQVIETLWRQGVVIWCFRCRKPIEPQDRDSGDVRFFVEREHVHEIALGGADTPRNCRYSHAACHHVVTNGVPATTAGSSKHKIGKVKRIVSEQKFAVVKIGPTGRPLEGSNDHAILANEPGNRGTAGAFKRKRKWPSRPMRGRVA